MKQLRIQLGAVLAATVPGFLAGCAPVGEPAPAPVAAAEPEAIRGVQHIGMTVSDIDATLAFYQAAVPYELVERQTVPASTLPLEILTKRGGVIEIALIRTPTVFLRLYDIDPAAPAAPERRSVIGPGYTHICFQSPSTAPKYDRFKALGLDILSRGEGPVDLGGYGVTYAYGFDPDGTMIEMEQLAPEVIAASGELGRKRTQHAAWVTHVANVVGDKAEMIAFYSTVLGYGPRREIPPTRRDTFDAVVDIDDIIIEASWFDVGNLELEFWHYVQPKTPLERTARTLDQMGYNSIVFEVTDLEGTVARLEAEGVQFAGEAFSLGGFTIRFARDPEGNLLAFQQRDAARPDLSIEGKRWIAEARAVTQ